MATVIQHMVMEEIRNQSNVIGYEHRGGRMRWEKNSGEWVLL